MDFKIDDDFEEKSENQKKNHNIVSTIVIAVVSIIIGLIVFFVSNAFFGKKVIPAEVPKDIDVALTDENVQILYDYVTYGVRDTRNDKFIKERNVQLSSFSNQEKFYYALQFAQVEDFEATSVCDLRQHILWIRHILYQ